MPLKPYSLGSSTKWSSRKRCSTARSRALTEFAAGAVVAEGMAKQVIDVGLDGPLEAGLDLEQRSFAEVFATEDARTGVASFLEHGPGKATFKGR